MGVNSTALNSNFIGNWTREQVVTLVSFVYVVVSILMVVLWSAYLCFDGRREPKNDTRVIHKLAETALLRAESQRIGLGGRLGQWRVSLSLDARSALQLQSREGSL